LHPKTEGADSNENIAGTILEILNGRLFFVIVTLARTIDANLYIVKARA
jgi:hypothetical protein